MEQEQMNELMEKLPPTPDGATFTPTKVEKISNPHPFCITPRHLTGESVYLTEDVIERSGAPCGVPGCQLGIHEHETHITLFVEVEDNRVNLNDIEGLHPWLVAIKKLDLGIEGFAFPNKRGGA